MAIRQTQDTNNTPDKVGTQYTVRNPHPGWNAENPEEPFDPNIKNEYGHTHYPKSIDHPWKKEVLVSHTSVNIGGGQTRQERNVHEKDAKGRQFSLKVTVNSKEEEDRVLAEKDPSIKEVITPIIGEGDEPTKQQPIGWKKTK